MLRTLKAFALVAAVGVLVAGSVQAQTGKGSIQFNSVGSTSACYGTTAPNNAGCWYTSPYKARLMLTSGPTPLLPPPIFATSGWGPVVDIYCVDFSHHVTSYAANFSSLADPTSVATYTRAGNVAQYLKAAWLAAQLKVNPGANGAINGAIWNVMGWPLNYVGSNGTAIATWVGYANANYTSVSASDWVVISDANRTSGNGQEYIVNVTPEPATLLLLGSGLLAALIAAGVGRRLA